VDVHVDSPSASGLTYEEWVTERVAALLRFAYLVTGSQDAAEEAVQSALTEALRHWERVRRTNDPDAYVRRMVVNAHVSAWRRWGRRQSAVADVRGVEHGDPADAQARRDLVWDLCGELPARQRAALVLRFYEDLDYPEIARVLGISEVTARTHVHRALTALRARLTEEDRHE
jgi:RNA polymerase sigma-70 factor (sigma-E family)